MVSLKLRKINTTVLRIHFDKKSIKIKQKIEQSRSSLVAKYILKNKDRNIVKLERVEEKNHKLHNVAYTKNGKNTID